MSPCEPLCYENKMVMIHEEYFIAPSKHAMMLVQRRVGPNLTGFCLFLDCGLRNQRALSFTCHDREARMGATVQTQGERALPLPWCLQPHSSWLGVFT